MRVTGSSGVASDDPGDMTAEPTAGSWRRVAARFPIGPAVLALVVGGMVAVMYASHRSGHWWGDDTEGLPLPITVCGIRRDIDEEERRKIALDLKRSIAYALGHRDEAIEYARAENGRDLPEGALEKYIDRYVNDLSLDTGERGRQALQTLFDRSLALGLMKDEVDPEYHGIE